MLSSIAIYAVLLVLPNVRGKQYYNLGDACSGNCEGVYKLASGFAPLPLIFTFL
jgi:hypothetical protein